MEFTDVDKNGNWPYWFGKHPRGYFVYDAIWPSFYYSPVPTGKNAWLLGQGLFILIYFCGAIMAFNSERHVLNAISV